MKILIAQTGLHHVTRGAEIAFTSVAEALVRDHGDEVTLTGMGPALEQSHYRYVPSFGISRSRFAKAPTFPPMRDDTHWEDLSFAAGLRFSIKPRDYDVTMSSDFPFTQMALRARLPLRRRTPHVYVTHSGDWAPHATNAEFRFFRCDGLICINPEYYERNKDRWFSRMIPNGVDTRFFRPGTGCRQKFGIPTSGTVILMVAALIPTKRVLEGIEIAARISDAVVVVAGSGPLHDEVQRRGSELLGDRFRLLEVPRSDMAELYRTADVYLHMSKVEPGALVYSEALASGLPIVAHDTPVTRWLIGDHASLVDADDAEAVQHALGQELQSDTPERTAARAATAGTRYSWDVVAKETHDFLAEVIERCEMP